MPRKVLPATSGLPCELHASNLARRGGNHKKRNWAMIGGGAGGGALIGAIPAGGKGALIGGLIGAGAGIAAAARTGKKDFDMHARRPPVAVVFALAGIKDRYFRHPRFVMSARRVPA